MVRGKIRISDVKALKPGEIIWDSTVLGFGARRQRSTIVTYVLVYRNADGRQHWITIGRHGSPWTPETARDQARALLGDVARGSDPAAERDAKRNAKDVAELCDAYLADAEAGRLMTRRRAVKKASTVATDRFRIIRHIKPLLGTLKVKAVTRADIEAFMHDVAAGKTAGTSKADGAHGLTRVRGGKGTASRTVGLLGSIFSYAMRHGMRPDNPVRGVERFADGERTRRLSDVEYRALGTALGRAAAADVWPAAVAAVRFLALTGWRRGEALMLTWRDVDLARRTASLPDTKTGRSMRPLSTAACDVLSALTRGKDDELVFPATRADGRMSGFPKLWARIAKLGKLPADVTPHTLRHSFSSLAADLGYSEPTIAALIGHRGQSITSRYVHHADAVLLAAADAVANRTLELMGTTKPSARVVKLNWTRVS
jgi:integrase